MSIKHSFAITAAALTLAVGPALAGGNGVNDFATDQAAAHSVTASAVGHWVYDRQGNTIGSVRSLAADGRTAVLMVGSYFEPGSHVASISSSALSIVNGKVILRTETIDTLRTADQR